MRGKPLYVKNDPVLYLLWYPNWGNWGAWVITDALEAIEGCVIYYGNEGDNLPANPWQFGFGDSPPPILTSNWDDIPLDTPHGIEYTPSSNVLVGSLKITMQVDAGANYQCAIYKDSDKSLVSTTIEEYLYSSTDPQEEYSIFASPPTLVASTKYYLIAWASSSSLSIGVEATPQDGYTLDTSNVYNSWPNPASSFTATNEHYMIEISNTRQSAYSADIYIESYTDRDVNYYGDVVLSSIMTHKGSYGIDGVYLSSRHGSYGIIAPYIMTHQGAYGVGAGHVMTRHGTYGVGATYDTSIYASYAIVNDTNKRIMWLIMVSRTDYV